MNVLSNSVSDSLNGSNLLEIAKLSKSFGGLRAVRDLSVEVKKGEILGLIGPNGAGKTTTFNLISGLLKPDSGSIRFKGKLVSGLPPHSIFAEGIGRTFQIVRVFQKMKVLDNLLVAGLSRTNDMNKIKDQAHEILEFLNLQHLREEYGGNISGGQQKLLEFGRVLMLDPELFLLDEPFVGVHPEIRMQIDALIEKVHLMGKTFFIISHDMKSIFSICNRVIVLSSGTKIADGGPATIRHDERVLEAYLGD